MRHYFGWLGHYFGRVGHYFGRVGWVGVSGGRCTLIMPFGKTLVAFDFDEKFTQSVAQITILYHVSRLSSPALCG